MKNLHIPYYQSFYYSDTMIIYSIFDFAALKLLKNKTHYKAHSATFLFLFG